MAKSKEIVLGGSGFGMSHWLGYLVCPKRQVLLTETPHTLPRENERLNAAFVGTLGHAYLEEWHNERWDPEDGPLAFEFEEAPLHVLQSEQKEAFRAATAYTHAHDRLEFSDVATEYALEDNAQAFPEVPQLTARIDMLGFHAGGTLRDSNGVYLSEGWYIVDHKFVGSMPRDAAESHRLQLETYIALWNASHPNTQVFGGIVNAIVRTKEVRFTRGFVPAPSEQRLDMIRETLALCADIAQGRPKRNLSSCNDTGYFEPCGFRASCLTGEI